MKKTICSLLILSLIAIPAYSASNYEYSQQSTTPNKTVLRGHITTLPAGTVTRAYVRTPLSSATLTTGQTVTLSLDEDLYNNNVLIAKAGSTINGVVIKAVSAKHGSINGQLNIKFTEIVTTTGQRIPICASIRTSDGTGVLKGGTKMDTTKEYVKDMGVGAGSGALLGLVGAAVSGGAVGKGTAIMTGVGAGVGLAKSVIDEGKDVNIPSNSVIEIYFDQPVTVDTKNSYSYEF